ncbi:MAG TPA: hypothetical protein VNK52_01580 [Hyphomicrobiaceae bacterium]|nr:hypothetical protein [Hyphomicrobiaceae bacterium]
MASTATNTPQGATATPAAAAAREEEVRVYQHSPILYWWVVWAYGYLCALLTFAHGEQVTIAGSKPMLVHPSPWVGISFTAVLLFVIIATTVRARGATAVMLALLVLLSGAAVYGVLQVEGLFRTPPVLLVHLNLAFYMLISSVLLVVWFVVVFIVDSMSYWRFRGTHIERVRRFGGVVGRAAESYPMMHVKLTRFSDDLFAHKLLGLGLLGLGTSDIEAKITIVGGGSEQFRIEHVWRAARPLRRIQALMGPKATVVV